MRSAKVRRLRKIRLSQVGFAEVRCTTFAAGISWASWRAHRQEPEHGEEVAVIRKVAAGHGVDESIDAQHDGEHQCRILAQPPEADPPNQHEHQCSEQDESDETELGEQFENEVVRMAMYIQVEIKDRERAGTLTDEGAISPVV